MTAMRNFCVLLLFILPLFSLPVSAQDSSAAATVGFTCNFPGSNPDHYAISIPEKGRAHYESTEPPSQTAGDDTDYKTDFDLSDATRQRIFDLARQADYFSGKIESGKKVASSGEKTLTYDASERHVHATYNYSTIPSIIDLTQIFQGLSTTLEYGKRLAFKYRFQKLALDEELKGMEGRARAVPLSDVETIAPILKKIANDPSVIAVSRARAQRLLGQN